MKRDEFNDIHSINDGRPVNREFFKTQKSEYSDHNENLVFGKSEQNSTKITNDDPALVRSESSKKKNVFDQTRHVVRGSSAATAASGAVHATVAVASVVAIGVVSTVTGIQIVNQSKASVEFKRFFIHEQGLDYWLVLRDADEKEAPYSIRIENANYSMSQKLEPGENEGYFEGLQMDETYTVSVLQEGFGGKNIYQEQFVVTPSSLFYLVYFDGEVDFSENSFEVYLSYEDPADRYHDLTFVLENQEQELRYNLQKTYDPQTITFEEGVLEEGQTYRYSLRYFDRDTEKVLEGEEVTLTAKEIIDPQQGEVHGIEWDYLASFSTGEASIRLQYTDPQNHFSDFSLTFEDENNQYYYVPLEKITEEQIIDLSDLELAENHCNFDLSLTYYDNGEPKYIDYGNITIVNIDTPEAHVDAVTFEAEINASTRELSYSIDYRDDADVLQDEFYITLTTDDGISFDIVAAKTKDTQTVVIDDYFPISSSGTHVQYVLTYTNTVASQDLQIEGDTILYLIEDVSTPALTDFVFYKTINFETGALDIVIAFSDPQSQIESIEFVLTDTETSVQQNFSLDLLSGKKQTIYVQDFNTDSFNVTLHAMSYVLQYVIAGETIEFVHSADPFYFTDSRVSQFNDIVSPYQLTSDGYLPIKLDIIDEKEIYSSPHLVFKNGSDETVFDSYLGQEGEEIYEWNYVYLQDITNPTAPEPLLGTYYLSLYITDSSNLSGTGEVALIDSREVTITDGSSTNEILGMRISNKEIMADNPIFNVILFYLNADGFTNYQLVFDFGDKTYQFPFEVTLGMSRFNYFSCDPTSTLNGDELAEFLETLGKNPVNVGLSYENQDGETSTIFDYIGIHFDVL